MLDIVNEKDEVIGQDSRENIHDKGLLHREIGMWIYNDKNQVALQKRSMIKKNYPGCWSDSVAGHVESGDSYDVTAIRELEEETGIVAKEDELFPIQKMLIDGDLEKSGHNSHFEFIYAYKFKDGVDNLRVEIGGADEIKWWHIDELLNAEDDLQKQFVPYFFSEVVLDTLRKVRELSKS